MLSRTERLFALAEYLRGRRSGVTAQALADRFEVTVRTVHRDLEALRGASLPISSERGRGGGFALDAHYTLPPINISAREAAVLLLMLQYAREMRLLPFEKTLLAAGDKVRAALSSSAQRELARRLDALAFVGVPAHAVDPRVAQAVEQSWFEACAITLHYPGASYAVAAPLTFIVRRVIFDRAETRLSVELDDGRPRQLRLHWLSWPGAPRASASANAQRAPGLDAAARARIRARASEALRRGGLPVPRASPVAKK